MHAIIHVGIKEPLSPPYDFLTPNNTPFHVCFHEIPVPPYRSLFSLFVYIRNGCVYVLDILLELLVLLLYVFVCEYAALVCVFESGVSCF